MLTVLTIKELLQLLLLLLLLLWLVTSILAQALNWNMDFSPSNCPLSVWIRVFVDGHDAWVLGKECVDYLERGPRRRRSGVRGCSSVPLWHLVRQTGAFKQLNLSDHSHQLMLVYYLSSSTAIIMTFTFIVTYFNFTLFTPTQLFPNMSLEKDWY